MKTAFCFTIKALLVLKQFTFSFCLFGHAEKWFDKKAMVNIKIYDITTREQVITIHILPTISISEGNQTMKFGQLIEHNMRNIFLENSYAKICWRK